jgi:hypothetical protein
MDIRWAQAKKAAQDIDPQAQNVSGDVAVENGKLNTWVDSQIKPGWLVADPGKIWALNNRMAGKTIAGLPAAINYGWHIATSKGEDQEGCAGRGRMGRRPGQEGSDLARRVVRAVGGDGPQHGLD